VRSADLKALVDTGSGIREMMRAASRIPDAVHLEVGQPDWEPPAEAVEAAVAALRRPTGYTPSLGIQSLRERVAERTAERVQLDVDADMVAVTPGAVCAVATLAVLCSGPEVPLLVPDATWPNYMLMPAVSGAPLIGYPLVDDLPDLDFLTGLNLDRALLVVNSPANPTGAVVDERLLGDLLELARSRGWFVLADEIYEDLVWGGSIARAATLAGGFDGLAVVSGVSKGFSMTGYRIGWFVADSDLVRQAQTVLETLVSCPSGPSQEAALAALNAPPGYLEAVRARLAPRAASVEAACTPEGLLPRPSRAGLYAWLDLGERVGDGRRFAFELLEQERIAVAPGSAFGPGGEGHVRIALVGSPELLGSAVGKLARFWEGYAG
jgi:aspartate aminotransferase